MTWLCVRCSRPAELFVLRDGRRRPYCRRHQPWNSYPAETVDEQRLTEERLHEAAAIVCPKGLPALGTSVAGTAKPAVHGAVGGTFSIGRWVRTTDSFGKLGLVLGVLNQITAECGFIHRVQSEIGYESFCSCILEPAIPREGEWWRVVSFCGPHERSNESSKAMSRSGVQCESVLDCACVCEPINFGRGE